MKHENYPQKNYFKMGYTQYYSHYPQELLG